MTRSVLIFNLLPGRRDDFVQTVRGLEVLQTSSFQTGYRGAQLHIDVDDPDAAMVIAHWDSPASYEGWLENPVREKIALQLRPFCLEEPQGRVFEVVEDIAPETPVTRS
jgi:heme-degrading monooxygenase HmoA